MSTFAPRTLAMDWLSAHAFPIAHRHLSHTSPNSRPALGALLDPYRPRDGLPRRLLQLLIGQRLLVEFQPYERAGLRHNAQDLLASCADPRSLFPATSVRTPRGLFSRAMYSGTRSPAPLSTPSRNTPMTIGPSRPAVRASRPVISKVDLYAIVMPAGMRTSMSSNDKLTASTIGAALNIALPLACMRQGSTTLFHPRVVRGSTGGGASGVFFLCLGGIFLSGGAEVEGRTP